MRVFSFDCATKSLGVAIITYNENWRADLKAATSIKQMLDIVSNIINLEYVYVFDIAPNGIKTISSVEKSIRLKSILNGLECRFPAPDIVLIEYQMNSNQKSHDISSKIEYHYAGGPAVEIIGPSLKNTVAFSPNAKYTHFTKKYMNLYTANKNHTKFNFMLFLDEFNKQHLIKHIAKKNIDDAADAFMMAFAYIKKNYIKLLK